MPERTLLISEVLQLLQDLKTAHGDVGCAIFPVDEGGNYVGVGNVVAVATRDGAKYAGFTRGSEIIPPEDNG